MPDAALDRLHRELGFKRLNPLWAKFEILFGLFAVSLSVFGGLYVATRPADATGPAWVWAGFVVTFTFGGYLALAGHRSHLYQSNNRLAAHLAELIRKNPPTPPGTPP